MRFTKIRVTDKGVDLSWTTKKADGETISSELKSPQEPLPDLPAALQAFRPYVLDLVDLDARWGEELIITQLSIGEQTGDENLRNLIVTARRRCEKANGRPVVFNTPFLPEAGENTSPNIATLDDATLELIADAEAAATRYVNGERAQATLDLGADDDEGDVEIPKGDDRPVERKRGRKGKTKQEDWTAAPPPRLSDEQAGEILAATGVERG